MGLGSQKSTFLIWGQELLFYLLRGALRAPDVLNSTMFPIAFGIQIRYFPRRASRAGKAFFINHQLAGPSAVSHLSGIKKAFGNPKAF